MIKKLKIIQYRKLKDLEFLFSENINVISGTNGTCKTSLLHLISNSFQTFSKKEKLINGNSTQVIRWLNKECNPKIESLTRGDREYSDPANGIKGTLFSVEYFDGKKLDFRRHNSNKESLNGRFSIKPKYKKGKNESLPHLLLIYLGLSRLYSFGEFNNDGGIEKIKKKLPLKYIQEIEDIYKDFTGIEIKYENSCLMSGIKRRSEFKTNYQGIDSNTISAGEDNLLIIITALVSLKYHHENAIEGIELTSILLVDEIDATLHPEYQIKLLELFLEYSRKYKIQIFLTTHSMSLLEYCLEEKFNVIYLLDDINKISIMKDINKYKIERILKNKTRQEINSKKIIPIFTEDEEARLFLSRIFNQLENIDSDFKKIKKFFYLVNINMSCHD
ncbi:hypothetical protein A2U11_10085 [Fusobacterium necrophorum subsp. funduliforme]|uniref:AAA family ATPase n=1 Tax=Fusobacterium necrophorum TaxID=859 RepID=UPI00078968BA|nr:AAA family ATPase [Fusobacterium necrophorum]KYM49762.1 hypothetical protein A2U11_10085 [Fusobacterium necrophorum subsp. funduliforme]